MQKVLICLAILFVSCSKEDPIDPATQQNFNIDVIATLSAQNYQNVGANWLIRVQLSDATNTKTKIHFHFNNPYYNGSPRKDVILDMPIRANDTTMYSGQTASYVGQPVNGFVVDSITSLDKRYTFKIKY